ncbi:MAG: hypothetical protein NTW59_04160 [Candidatus Diapherotrites archaeon]|nr:hypothetical protein [Candidatus Diapherotrites archaeon]
MIVTVFLCVLVLALIFGNVFLSLTSPERVARANMKTREKSGGGNALKEIACEIEGEDRVKMLSGRIERLENIILRLNNKQFVAKKINGTSLYQKINDLETFKQDAKLEIAALKQQLAAIMPPEARRAKKETVEIEPEQLHRFVFRSAE